MKTLPYIIVVVIITLGSCTSRLYTGAEYDDLYYLASDKPVVNNFQPVNERVMEESGQTSNYYDNIYAADTLISDEYLDAVDYDNQVIINNNNYTGGYDYYDNYSYASRINRFHSSRFYPYWRDPYYYGGYSSFGYGMGYGMGFGMGYGYGGFPYYSPFYRSSYYGYGGFNDYWGYGGYYGGYYGRYYGGYSPYYSAYNTKHSVPYGRRERPSTLSSRWNNNVSGGVSSRRDPSLSSGRQTDIGGRTTSGTQSIATDSRRENSGTVNSRQAISSSGRQLSQDPVKGADSQTKTATQRNASNVRPEYNSTNRTYTPTYSNPRMSTRPSYNNSRVVSQDGSTTNRNTNINSGQNSNTRTVNPRSNQNSYQNRSSNYRSTSSGSNVQQRAVLPSNRSIQYSVPSRRSTSSGSGYSSGSTYRSSTPSRSSSSSGSSYRSSSSSGGSSYSSGSSSSGGSSRSSGSSSRSSSGSRR